MEKIQIVRELLIQRYSKLKNVSVEKAKSNFNNNKIDDIIEKHYTSITLSILLVVLITIPLIIHFIILYKFSTHYQSLALVSNIMLLIIFLKGLHDNYEIKQILKMLKEIGEPAV